MWALGFVKGGPGVGKDSELGAHVRERERGRAIGSSRIIARNMMVWYIMVKHDIL